uniref:AB hydrolase-1 domain-containing protein n=1 Tax=Amblyomma maculatum TaxID=34609 RepID=G3MMC3_AMBMU
MGIWMQAYVKTNILFHGRSILIPKNRTVPNEFYNEDYGEHKYVNVSNITFHYVTKGCENEQRTMLLLLHGFLDFWFIWNRQIPELSKEFCVVAPDLRGYGNTTRPTDTAEYLMPKLIGDVKGLIEELNPGHKRKVVLVGHDWGGMISLCFATLHETLIDKMVIINGMHPKAFLKQLFRSPTQMRMSWYMLPFRRPVVPEQYLIMKDLQFFDKVHKGFTEREEYAHKYVYSQPGALTGTINYYRAFNNDSDQFNKLPFRKINVPTLILWGQRDAFITRRVARYNQEWLTQSQLIYYEGAGHFPLRECPTHVTGRIIEFVKTGTVIVNKERRWWTSWWASRRNDPCSNFI